MSCSRNYVVPFLVIVFSVLVFVTPSLFGFQISFDGVDIIYDTNIFVFGFGLSTLLALNNLTHKNVLFVLLCSFVFITLDVFSLSLTSLLIILINKKLSYNVLKLLSLIQFVVIVVGLNDIYLLSILSMSIIYILFFNVDVEHRLLGVLLHTAILAETCNNRYVELCVLISFLVLSIIMTSGNVSEKKLKNIFFLTLATYLFLFLLGYTKLYFPFLIFILPIFKKESLCELSSSLFSTFLFLLSIVILVMFSQLDLFFFMPVLFIILISVKRIIDISRNSFLSNESMVLLITIVFLSLIEIKTKGLL